MAVTLNKANLVLKDANGNIGKIEQLSNRDLAKIRTAVSDVALVVNQSNHKPIVATTTNVGVVQLATSADVVSGASNKVVTAEQLHNATTGTTSALATENLARIDAVVTEAGIPIDHTNTNQLKTAVTTLVNNAVPSTATSTTLGVVKPDNDTITIDSNGVLTATNASKKYLPLAGGNLNSTSDNPTVIGLKTDDAYFIVRGGTDYNTCAGLYLSGLNTIGANNPSMTNGAFVLQVPKKDEKTKFYNLKGTSTGLLQWNGFNLVRSVNGVTADDNGIVNITQVSSATKATQDSDGNKISTTYFKKSGGQLTGSAILRNVDTSSLVFSSGTEADTGGTIYLAGKDYVDDTYKGSIRLTAQTSDTNKSNLMLYPNGIATWGGANLVRSVNGVNADVNGNVVVSSSGANYVRYANGVQICFGKTGTYQNIDRATITMAMPFINSNFIVLVTDQIDSNNKSSCFSFGSKPTSTTTALVICSQSTVIWGFSYIAIGRWK